MSNAKGYEQVEREINQVLAAKDPATAAAAHKRALLALARVAAGPEFDMRRHRAIAMALRDIEPSSGAPAPVAPLLTRGGAR